MSRDDFLAFRRSLGRTPPLDRMTVRVRGLELAVFTSPPVAGRTPLLLVNGGLIYDHSLLWPALSPLAAGRQLVLYDQRGRGGSQLPPDPHEARIEDDADDIGALRRALGIRQWDVLGHSWGGGIALLGAAGDQTGTRRLVTVNAVGPTSAWMPPLHEAQLARLAGEELIALRRMDAGTLHVPDPAVHAAHGRTVYRAWFADPDLAAYFKSPTSTSVTGAAVAARLRREGYDRRERLRALSTPVLVIHGEQDALPAAVALELVGLLPRARLTLLPNAGHMPFWEAPAPFFDAVTAFLDASTVGLRR